MIKNKKLHKGLTFVELILYVGLVSIFISGAILFAWDVVYGNAKSNTQRLVTQELRHASERMLYEIRNASGVYSVSEQDLCLSSADPGYNPVHIYVNANRLYIGWGGGDTSCASTTYAEALTSGFVNVSSLSFSGSSGNNSIGVQFDLVLSTTSDRQEFQQSVSLASTGELRFTSTTPSPEPSATASPTPSASPTGTPSGTATPTPTPTPTPTASPTPTPTPAPITTCDQYCKSLGYGGGVCRNSVNNCTRNGGTAESGGNQYCTSGQNTCCCQ